MPTAAQRARGLRGRPAGSVLFIAVLMLAIFLVARGCQTRGIELTQEEAIAIAKQEVDFTPDHVGVRLLRQGVRFTPHWAVSLSERRADGSLENITIVMVNAATGEVTEVRRA